MTKSLLLLSAMASAASAAIVEKPVIYEHNGTKLEGWHVYDDAIEGPRPAVLVIHQWTGLTDYEKGRSKQLAELGYNVLAADIYGQGVRPQPPAAGTEAGKYKKDRQLFRERLLAALKVLHDDKMTDPLRIAAIGYCFGGTGVLELARSGAELNGVVSFHGGLDAAEGMHAKAPVTAKILVLHGDADPFVPKEQVEAFEKEMAEAKANVKIVKYPGAVHAFTQKGAGDDPSKGAAYNAEADAKSWQEMKDFFAKIFKPKSE